MGGVDLKKLLNSPHARPELLAKLAEQGIVETEQGPGVFEASGPVQAGLELIGLGPLERTGSWNYSLKRPPLPVKPAEEHLDPKLLSWQAWRPRNTEFDWSLAWLVFWALVALAVIGLAGAAISDGAALHRAIPY